MACVALSSLMRTIQLELLNPGRTEIVDDDEQVKYLYQGLAFLKELLNNSKGNIAAKNLAPKIKDLAFRIEDRIEKELEAIYGEAYSDPERKEAQGRLPSTLKQAMRDTEDLSAEVREIHTKQPCPRFSMCRSSCFVWWFIRTSPSFRRYGRTWPDI